MVWTFILRQVKRILSLYKGAYIKYVGEGAAGFYKFFKKFLVAQENMKIFHGPSHINFSFLFKAYL